MPHPTSTASPPVSLSTLPVIVIRNKCPGVCNPQVQQEVQETQGQMIELERRLAALQVAKDELAAQSQDAGVSLQKVRVTRLSSEP